MKLKHIIILQNKIDLIRDTQAKDQYQEILKFVQGMTVHKLLSVLMCSPVWRATQSGPYLVVVYIEEGVCGTQ